MKERNTYIDWRKQLYKNQKKFKNNELGNFTFQSPVMLKPGMTTSLLMLLMLGNVITASANEVEVNKSSSRNLHPSREKMPDHDIGSPQTNSYDNYPYHNSSKTTFFISENITKPSIEEIAHQRIQIYGPAFEQLTQNEKEKLMSDCDALPGIIADCCF